VVGNDGGVGEHRPTLLESGHTTVCRDIVRHRFGGDKVGRRRGEGVGKEFGRTVVYHLREQRMHR
jgi:hypothetical protein